MNRAMLLAAGLSLLPVLGLLGTLVLFDSYKLVSLPRVVALTATGAVLALAAYVVNGWLIGALGLTLEPFSRYVSPFVEEALKAAVIVRLLRRDRIGFLVDAAIVGFALGCGFAVAENLYALWRVPGGDPSTWVVRGFGTAIMHGGSAALFALLAMTFLERTGDRGAATLARALLPGYAAAVLLHAAFNRLSRDAAYSVPLVLLVVATLLTIAYQRGERTLASWLGQGFDADAERMALLRSGALSDSPTGRYLRTLRERFDGLVVADLLAYLRLFTELSMRAKGLLLMRENGFEPPADAEAGEQLDELAFLERSIGRTGLLALHPLLPMRRGALRQMLGG